VFLLRRNPYSTGTDKEDRPGNPRDSSNAQGEGLFSSAFSARRIAGKPNPGRPDSNEPLMEKEDGYAIWTFCRGL